MSQQRHSEQQEQQRSEQPRSAWEQCWDAESGYPYWLNHSTGESSWHDPNGHDDSERTATTGTDSGEGQWVECFDNSSRLAYWHHTTTGETSWENPDASRAREYGASAGADAGAGAGAGADDGAEWIECTDPSTTATYWYHSRTGESTWDDPTLSAVGVSEESPVDAPWVMCDDGQGNIYYYNEVTQESSWEAPKRAHSGEAPTHSSTSKRSNSAGKWNEKYHHLYKTTFRLSSICANSCKLKK